MFFFFFCAKCANNRIQTGLESLSAKSPHNQLPIACNPPDIKCINAFIEKAIYFGRNTENSSPLLCAMCQSFHRCWRYFAITELLPAQ